MATLMRSLIDKYNTLTAANFPGAARPPLYHTRASQTTGAGAQLRLPYVTVVVTADQDVATFEDDAIESFTVTMTAYAESKRDSNGATVTDGQADADTIIACVRFNGQAKSVYAGFDNSPTLTNFSDGTFLGLFPVRDAAPRAESGMSKDGYNVYSTTMTWRAEVQRS